MLYSESAILLKDASITAYAGRFDIKLTTGNITSPASIANAPQLIGD
jgi:hypothetical protein